ncbi:MAG: peptidylprolyl isomerase [Myxococcota bacterium]
MDLRQRIRGKFREPLLHFVAIGAMIFGVDRALGGTVEVNDPQTLHVTADMVEVLAARHVEKTGRSPDAATRRALVNELVRGEVLQRQARALGLDYGDLVVQRRLAQKMEFLLESQAKLEPPTDAQLLQWRDTHPERYRKSDRLRFEHRVFSTQRRGPTAEADAKIALAQIAEDPDSAATLGDPSAHGSNLSLDPVAIDRRFGPGFAERLQQLPPKDWHGPISSRRGVHLVRVIERIPGELASLDELRERLREDLLRDRRERAREAAIEALMEGYQIELDPGVLEPEGVA